MSLSSPPALRPIDPLDQSRPEVLSFNCGSANWEIEVAQHLATGQALQAHQRRKAVTQVYCDLGGAGDVLGYVSYIRKLIDLGGSAKVQNLHILFAGIDKSHQSNGYGSAILDFLEAFAKSKGDVLIDLYVHEHNSRAQRLYQRHGFTFTPQAPYPDKGHNYLRMWKSI